MYVNYIVEVVGSVAISEWKGGSCGHLITVQADVLVAL